MKCLAQSIDISVVLIPVKQLGQTGLNKSLCYSMHMSDPILEEDSSKTSHVACTQPVKPGNLFLKFSFVSSAFVVLQTVLKKQTTFIHIEGC